MEGCQDIDIDIDIDIDVCKLFCGFSTKRMAIGFKWRRALILIFDTDIYIDIDIDIDIC